MDQVRVPPWVLWALCALSLAIAGLLSLLRSGDPVITWIVCGSAAGFLAFIGVLLAYHGNVERRILTSFRRGHYLAHWTYPGAHQPNKRARNEAYVGREGALYGGELTCWKSLTTRLRSAAILPGPPPVLEVVFELGGALADAVLASPSERRLHIPVPPGHEPEARRVAQVLTELAS